MCGIAFFVNYGEKKMNINLFYDLFSMLSIRGTDSSGYYFERMEEKKSVKRMIKAPIESKKFIKTMEQWKEGDALYKFKLNGTEKLIMFHCRQKTRGSELNNKNNMPIASKNYVLIHNGVMLNTKLKDYDYSAEVDSEEILARVEKMGVKKGIKECDGSMSIALKPIDRDTLFLYRNSNPLEIVFMEKDNILMGCSNANYVEPFDKTRIGIKIFKTRKNYVELPSQFLFTLNLNKHSIIKIAEIPCKGE